jgi:hypothetical protein
MIPTALLLLALCVLLLVQAPRTESLAEEGRRFLRRTSHRGRSGKIPRRR